MSKHQCIDVALVSYVSLSNAHAVVQIKVLNENQVLVEYEDPDKADKVLEGDEMIAFLVNFLHAQAEFANGTIVQLSGEEVVPSDYEQASVIPPPGFSDTSSLSFSLETILFARFA